MRARLFIAVAAALALMPAAARAQALIADLSEHLIAITAGFSGTDVLLFGATEGEGDARPGRLAPQDLVPGPGAEQPALAQEAEMGPQGLHLLQAVGGDEGGAAALREVTPKVPEDLGLGLRVQVVGGLVP